MLVPYQKPEVTKYSDICIVSLLLVSSQVSLVYLYYVMFYGLNTKPFMVLFVFLFGIIVVYVLGYILDNSPLLGVTSLFVCYVVIYYMNMVTRYNNIIVLVFAILIVSAAYVKDKSMYLDDDKKHPILFNVFLYLVLGAFCYAIPCYIYNQNREQYMGLQML